MFDLMRLVIAAAALFCGQGLFPSPSAFWADPVTPPPTEAVSRLRCPDLVRMLRACHEQSAIDCAGFESLYDVDCAGAPPDYPDDPREASELPREPEWTP
jgi:hypothetical protein